MVKDRWHRSEGSLLAVCLAVFSLFYPAGPAAAGDPGKPSVIFLVRHAEKQNSSDDPALTEAGQRRAEALADLLQHSGIERIYSTDFARTRETAAPLAGRLDLPITLYDWEEMQALAADLKTSGLHSLVVGHSDTTPELVGLLGGDPGPAIDEQAEYDRLYVVTVAADRSVTSELRRYGAN